MNLKTTALAATVLSATLAMHTDAQAGPFEDRERDWRNGAIVYQVLVDRFAPPANLEAKRALYPAPKVLRAWTEEPKAGTYVESAKVWSHEIDFWGGDLQSVRTRLDHIQQLGADVVYLNPIHMGFTNHKYDSLDFQAVSPEFGTRDDVKALAADLKRRNLKLVLDGVFNHMGRNAPAFKYAEAVAQAEQAGRKAPAPPAGQADTRGWFVFDPQMPGGARTWKGVLNLPEPNLENAAVRDHLWAARDSVVRSYLRDGVDGWRLDVAYEIGPTLLGQLTEAAHREKPGSLVVGEIWNYPAGWMPAMDGVMNFHWRALLLGLVRGEISAANASTMIGRTVGDLGIEPLLKSWVLLDNHDVRRVHTELPDTAQRRLAQVLQFTLPGSPNLYYGAEVGMTGGDDPAQRGPMRWDLVRADHPEMLWTKQLVNLRKQHRALRVGNYRTATAEKLLAFERYTDRAADTVLVLANPSDQPVTESVQWRNGAMMDFNTLRDLLPPPAGSAPAIVSAGFVRTTVPPRSVRVLAPDVGAQGGYTVYKRVN
ncbi:MAG: alpha-amylase family glycosyl hydrolase [Rubrivivax sp.]